MKVVSYLTSHFIYENVFSEEECKQIIELSKNSNKEKAKVEEKNTHTKLNSKIRKTLRNYIYPSENTAWIGNKLLDVIKDANNKFQFKLYSLDELQVLEYKKNFFYTWHIDLTSEEIGATRKLSIVTFLSSESDYDGGELEFKYSKKIKAKQGSVIIFPSYLIHKVNKIKSGTRYTLVSWAHGDSFS